MLFILSTWVLPRLPLPGVADVCGSFGASRHVLDVAHHLMLPWVSFASICMARRSRLTRASMPDVMGADNMRSARAKGLSERESLPPRTPQWEYLDHRGSQAAVWPDAGRRHADGDRVRLARILPAGQRFRPAPRLSDATGRPALFGLSGGAGQYPDRHRLAPHPHARCRSSEESRRRITRMKHSFLTQSGRVQDAKPRASIQSQNSFAPSRASRPPFGDWCCWPGCWR